MRRFGQNSPIAARQMGLAAGTGLGRFGSVNPGGKATTSVYSGPPVGEGSGAGAMTGAAQGATVGSVAGPIGIAIGAIAGAIGGAIAGAINKVDPENANFQQAMQIAAANPAAVLNIANKYLVLAGLFDLEPSQVKGNIPIYKKYGRMGEHAFVTDMMTRIYQAAQSGQLSPTDTPQTIMVKVVQPWIDSWGFGPMVDTNAAMINMILMGMIAEYVAGLQNRWLSTGGDYSFGSLPKFSLSAAVAQPAPAGGSPSVPSTSSPGVPPVGTTVTATAGTVLTGNSGNSMVTPLGTVLASVGGDYTLNGHQLALTPQHTGGVGTTAMMWSGTQLLASNSDGTYLALDPNTYNWNPISAAAAVPVTTTPAPAGGTSTGTLSPAPTTVAIPAGFNVVGSDGASGVLVYVGPNGAYYTWTGTTMNPYTGTLVGGLLVQNGTAQASLNTSPSLIAPAQQSYNTAYPTPDMSSLGVPSPAIAPAQPAPTTAGVSNTPWATIGIVGLIGFFLATAHPKGGPHSVRMPRRSRRRK